METYVLFKLQNHEVMIHIQYNDFGKKLENEIL